MFVSPESSMGYLSKLSCCLLLEFILPKNIAADKCFQPITFITGVDIAGHYITSSNGLLPIQKQALVGVIRHCSKERSVPVADPAALRVCTGARI
ncbi:hypothetical protein ACIPL1_19260 [Pseudomonas sp. NPDC090202]|uniref:hypothetical protein n=1 Tax=unclassified Pseudomonas TaxID=196821 RepID=UPI00381B28FD